MENSRAVIEQLVTRFGRCADRGDGAELSLLFLENGMLEVNGKVANGREAIARFTNDRRSDPDQKARHVWSNLLIEEEDEFHVRSSLIQLTFEQRGVDQVAHIRLSDVVDLFKRCTDGDWRFAKRTISR